MHASRLPQPVLPVAVPTPDPIVIIPGAGQIIVRGIAPPLVQVGQPTSGLHDFRLSNADVLIEAFGRLGISPDNLSREHMISGRSALNLELESWSNAGLNLWTFTSAVIPLVPGTATYALPDNLVTVTDIYYTPTGGLDRALDPMTRTEYAGLVNKLQPGLPTLYWFRMLGTPLITLWQVPLVPASLTWFGYLRVQDANLPSGEVPQVQYRAIDALCAKLALRLCEKFGPKKPVARAKMMQEKRNRADEAWAKLQRRDQELGSTKIRPNMSYSRMRRPR